MYSFESRIRYSEIDIHSRLSLFAAINYLQDCSTFQSEDFGLGIEYLKNKNRAWWLSSWYIEFDRLPFLGEKITVSTWAYDFSGFYGYRNFIITDEAQNNIVRADSTWFFFDTEHFRPVKPGIEDIKSYMDNKRQRLSLATPRRKIEKCGKEYRLEDIMITRRFLDTNEHVNNAYYAAMAKEAVEEVTASKINQGKASDENIITAVDVKNLQIYYKKAAVLGDRVKRIVYETEKTYIIELAGENGIIYADIKLNIGKY
jgi:acyl carrier protein thioesteraseprotein